MDQPIGEDQEQDPKTSPPEKGYNPPLASSTDTPKHSTHISHDAAPNTSQQVDPTQQSRRLLRDLEWSGVITAVATLAIAILTGFYVHYAREQWQTANRQLVAMQGQLEQMKGSSTQADRLIGETHTLATNAGTQATNAADQVKKLSDLVAATNKQAAAMNGQLSIMREQLDATDRAWIAVEISAVNVPRAVTGGPLVFDDNGRGNMGLEVKVRNIGRSVANNASIRIAAFALSIIESISEIPEQRQRKLCGTAEGKQVMRNSILPNDTGGIYSSEGFDTKDIPNAMPELKNGKPIVVFVYGCVDYESAASPARHQTGFVLQAFGSRDTYKGIQVGATVAADQLTFRPYQFFGGNYAY